MKRKRFLSELDEFLLDFLKIRAKSDYVLQSCQTGNMEQVGLIVDKKVSEFIRLLGQVLLKEYANTIVYTVHEFEYYKLTFQNYNLSLRTK
jgi:hypothetical protein